LFAKVKGETSEFVQSVITAFIIIINSVCHMLLPALPKTTVDICLCYFLCLPKESNQRKGPLPWSLRACSDANAQQSVIKGFRESLWCSVFRL